MKRSPAAVATLAILVLAAFVPATSAFLSSASSEDPSLTFYLHGGPIGNTDALLEASTDIVNSLDAPVGVTYEPTGMSDEAPTSAADARTVATSLGNHAYRKNFLDGYWAGDVNGRVYDATATIWVESPVDVTLVATLFGDGGIGSGSPFASASASAPAGGPTQVTFDLRGGAANVESEIVLGIGVANAQQPHNAILVYASTAHPASLTFTLGAPVNPPPVEWTPAAGWAAPIIVNATAAHRETSLVVSPIDPDLLFACSPSGVPNTEFGQSFFHVSRDGGDSWSYLDVETGASDPRKLTFEGGDCDVAFDDAGNMYSADTWLGSLSVGVSRDGGATWSGTPLAASAPIVDRPWLVGGPDGTIHVTWQDVQFGMPSMIWYARSTAHALTFTPAVPVATAGPDGAFTWTGNPAVSADGQDLYSVYTRRTLPSGEGAESVWVAASHDGGATWTQHRVANMPNPASFLYPSLAMDPAGGLHVVFSSRTSVDRPIWYATSTDGALTWSTPMKLLANTAGWSPWVVSDAAGEAAVQWYGTLDRAGNTTGTHDWYFFTARVKDGVVTQAGPTTTEPIYRGVQSATPEFNQLRLVDGKIRLGMSAYFKDANGSTGWAIFYQKEA